MDQDYLISPVVKQTVKWLARVLAVSAAACALLLPLSGKIHSIGTFPVAETYLLSTYLASCILLLLAPWCVNVMLAGRGNQLIRLYGYAGWLLIPLGLLFSGFQAPLRELAVYYTHLLNGGVAYRDGFFLMQSFQTAASLSCVYLAILGLLSYPYTAGYEKRRSLLYWSILMLASAAVDTICAFIPLSPEGKFAIILLFYLRIALLVCFWFITSKFGFLLAKHVPYIASMPERNTPTIINKKKNG